LLKWWAIADAMRPKLSDFCNWRFCSANGRRSSSVRILPVTSDKVKTSPVTLYAAFFTGTRLQS
jgi:hypothetical protein